MRTPVARELLDAWERGLAQPPVHRALTLLASAEDQAPDEALWSLVVGERDARLFELRQRLFGPRLTFVASCPACAERLESSLDVAELCRERAPVSSGVHDFEGEGYRVRFRLPNCLDLMQTLGGAPGSPSERLLARCVLEVRDGGSEPSELALPEALTRALAKRMAELDPVADIQLELSCPACGHTWHTPFDIGGFLWTEVHAWARRTLREVHCLARAYGWTESETLALSPTRRSIYLELGSAALAGGTPEHA